MGHALTDDHDHREIDDRLLPWQRVKDITGLSRTTAWRLQKAGDFPPPVVISPGRVGWRESELQAWKASRAPRATAKPKVERSFLPLVEAHKPALTLPNPAPRDRPAPLSTKQRPEPGPGPAGQLRFEF
jgi:predicted DNA-binding transcriptional regulator AlpA